MRLVLLVGLCVPILAARAPAHSDRPMFPLQRVQATPAYLSGVHTADVDADGDLDILTASPNHLEVQLGDGNGYFPQTIHTTAAEVTSGMAVGDIDHDGYPDVAIASVSGNGVDVMLGVGDGSFVQTALVPAGSNPREPVLADFDGDGDLDLAVVRTTVGSLATALGDGLGGFGPVVNLPTASAKADDLAAADLDQDGDIDLVVAFGSFAGLQIYRGDGLGGFVGEPALTIPNTASDVLVADVTADGRPDLVACMLNAAAVTMLAGQAVGGFAAAQAWGPSVGGSPIALAAADIDGDGDLDVAVGTAQTFAVDTVRWLINEGGSSATLVKTPAGYDIGPVALGDLNGDGLIDLLTAPADGSVGVTAVLNALDPLLEAPSELPIPSTSITAVDSGDVDGDGKTEVVLLGTISGGVHVIAVAVPALAVVADDEINVSGTLPASLWSGDLDGDGRADLAVPDISADTVVIVHGESGGGFGAHTLVHCSLDPYSATGGDLDADGDLDLVTANRYQDTLDVLWNDGAGRFSAPEVLAVADAPTWVFVVDLDQDGAGDICVLHSTGSAMSLLYGAGNHGFEPPMLLAIGTSPDDMVAADLDLDGVLDMAVADAGGLRLIKGLGGRAFLTFAVVPAGASECVDVGDVDGDGLPDLLTDGSGGAMAVLYPGADLFLPKTAFNCQNFHHRMLLDADGDGRTDLIVGGNTSQTQLEVHWNVSGQRGPMQDVGAGLAGSNGTPHWSGLGTLQPQSALALALAHAKPGAPLTLVLGTSVLEAPFKGGTMVPQPQLLVSGLAANAAGQLSLSSTWPAGIPSGFVLATQCWIVDPAGPAGLAASNGLVLTAP